MWCDMVKMATVDVKVEEGASDTYTVPYLRPARLLLRVEQQSLWIMMMLDRVLAW